LCLLLVLFSAPARAQSVQPINTTGNAFYTPQSPMYGNCVYYLIGFVDGIGFLNEALERQGKQRLFCMPSGGGSVLGPVTGVQTILSHAIPAT
jgi:hypothetical protein